VTAHIGGPSGGSFDRHLDRPHSPVPHGSAGGSRDQHDDGGDTSRRRFLRIAGATGALGIPASLALLAGCTEDAPRDPGSAGDAGTPRPSPTRDPDLPVLRAAVEAEERLLDAYAATLERHTELRERLAPFARRHEAHLTALRTAANPTAAPAAPAGRARPGGRANAPATPTAALAALVDAEQAAAADRNTDLRAARGGDHARLLASIAACEATHAGQLGGETG
jgi:hypothetical protein